MNKQELLELYREFGSEAQDVLDFLKRNLADEQPSPEPKDGIYIVYKDGTYKPFSLETPKENASFVGIIDNGHSFGVGRLIGSYSLTNKEMPKDNLCVKEFQALRDWDFVKNTTHIQQLGTPIPLLDDEFIPTAPVFVTMANLADKGLNSALRHIGLQPLDLSEDYWFAQRYSSTSAWYFYGTYGYLSNGGVYGTARVQAVALWNPS